jgi:hypothetical protein
MITPLAATSLGDVSDHARRLLSHSGLRISEVVRVDVDSVLYIDPDQRARTAWVRIDADQLVIQDEPGFSADAPVVTAA